MSSTIVKRVSVCSKIPGLYELIRTKVNHLVGEVASVSPPLNNIVLADTDVLVADNDVMEGLLFEKLAQVRWIQGTWAGVDNLVRLVDKSDRRPELQLARFTHSKFSQLMAEYCVMGIINMERSYKQMLCSQMQTVWDTSKNLTQVRCLSELKVGILGASGAMGKATARMLHGLGCSHIYGFVNTPRTADHFIEQYFTGAEGLSQLLPKVDYLISILPATPQTNNLLSSDQLKLCRNVGFINIGRGNVVTEENVLTALDNGWLREAVLDVFMEEPVPVASPLWTHPRVTITPHVAGTSRPQDIAECFATNLERYLAGGQPHHLVDWDKLY